MTFARFTPAARNRIIGMRLAGAGREKIRDTIRKTDGNKANIRAVDEVLSNYEQDPEYDGENVASGGRPRSLTTHQEQAILRVLMRDVGKFVVTARYVKKVLPALRRIPDKTIQRTFDRLEYAYRDRRRKAWAEALCEAFGLRVALPDRRLGAPGGPYDEFCLLLPLTRMP